MRLINHSLGDGLIVLSQTSHHPSNFFLSMEARCQHHHW